MGNVIQERSYRGAKGAKAAFQILVKCCVFIADNSVNKKS